jgi:lysophospholipase L1-like esterase
VLISARRATGVPTYWRHRLNQPLRAGDLRLVAMGDSSVQGIGADTPMQEYMGRIADYVAAKTGRPVHISNVSTGGTTADIVRDQLPLVDLTAAYLVIVVDSNDIQQRMPPTSG